MNKYVENTPRTIGCVTHGGLRLLGMRARVLRAWVVKQRKIDLFQPQLLEVFFHIPHNHRRVGVTIGCVAKAGRDLRRDEDVASLSARCLENGADISLVMIVPGGVNSDR